MPGELSRSARGCRGPTRRRSRSDAQTPLAGQCGLQSGCQASWFPAQRASPDEPAAPRVATRFIRHNAPLQPSDSPTAIGYRLSKSWRSKRFRCLHLVLGHGRLHLRSARRSTGLGDGILVVDVAQKELEPRYRLVSERAGSMWKRSSKATIRRSRRQRVPRWDTWWNSGSRSTSASRAGTSSAPKRRGDMKRSGPRSGAYVDV